jgi:OmcA/MtrC family decaheme c-type cytochrome
MVATGYTARRTVVASARCNTCHSRLDTVLNPLATAGDNYPTWHGGVRDDATGCVFCHNTNNMVGGWSGNVSTFIHGIHGASQRAVPFNFEGSATWNFASLRYPGVLQDCSQCHVPNAVNLGASGMALSPTLLWTTDVYGTVAAGPTTAPYVTTGLNYGQQFLFTPQGSTVATYTTSGGVTVPAHVAGAGGDFRPADPTTLVNSPLSAACFACHDTASDKNHMQTNGGSIYQPRSNTALASPSIAGEACLVCHGQGQIEDVAAVHQSVFLTGSP